MPASRRPLTAAATCGRSSVGCGSGSRQNRPNQPDAGQRQVIEGDVEEGPSSVDRPVRAWLSHAVRLHRKSWHAPSSPCLSITRLGACATEEGLPRGAFGGGQEPVAVAEAWQRVEHVELRLAFLLHPFGFGEERAGFGALAGLVQGIRRRGAFAHSLERIAALVGVGDRLAGIGHGVRQPAQRHLQLAEVAGT